MVEVPSLLAVVEGLVMPPTYKTLYNLYEVRDILGVSLRTVYHMIADGRLIKVDKKYNTFVTLESIKIEAEKRGIPLPSSGKV